MKYYSALLLVWLYNPIINSMDNGRLGLSGVTKESQDADFRNLHRTRARTILNTFSSKLDLFHGGLNAQMAELEKENQQQKRELASLTQRLREQEALSNRYKREATQEFHAKRAAVIKKEDYQFKKTQLKRQVIEAQKTIQELSSDVIKKEDYQSKKAQLKRQVLEAQSVIQELSSKVYNQTIALGCISVGLLIRFTLYMYEKMNSKTNSTKEIPQEDNQEQEKA